LTRYFDASALVKRYWREAGGPEVESLLLEGGCATARLSLVEVASALARRSRAGDLEDEEAVRLAGALAADADRFALVELTSEVEARARALVAAHPLRAGDAVQLASCLRLREESGEPIEFVAYDARLNRAARAEGLRTRGARPA